MIKMSVREFYETKYATLKNIYGLETLLSKSDKKEISVLNKKVCEFSCKNLKICNSVSEIIADYAYSTFDEYAYSDIEEDFD